MITTTAAFPALASAEWHALLEGIGQLGAEPAVRAAFSRAYQAGVSAAEFCGIQLDAPARPADGPIVFFGMPRGPYAAFSADGPHLATVSADKDWPDITDGEMVAWENEAQALIAVADEASRAAGAGGDAAAAPYLARREKIIDQIMDAPCNSRTAAIVKGRMGLKHMDPGDASVEATMFEQIVYWLASDAFLCDVAPTSTDTP